MLPRLICCALIALTLSQFLSVMAVRAQVQHTIIAASGDAAPAGGNYVTFLNTFALNARGDGTTTTPIALEGTAAPGSTGTFASFANIKIGNDGQVSLGPLQSNSERSIVWLGRFADNSTAVVSSDVDGEFDP